MEQPQINTEITSKTASWKITYNAKFTLSFCILAGILLLANMGTGGLINQALAVKPVLSITGAYRLISYIFCHANFQHFIGNVLFLLMLGPILEEKYGTKLLAVMTAITAITTGVLNILLFNDSIIGASGIVFMFIVLSSIVNMKQKEIPMTFIFITIIYIGGEVINSFNNDNISQFGHIIGGVCGAGLGFLFNKSH